MYTPDTENLTAYRYGTFEHEFQFEGIDVADYTFYSQIRERNSRTLIATFDITTAGTSVIMSLDRETLEAIEPDVYAYDLKAVSATQKEIYFVTGDFKVANAITETP